MLNYIIVFDKVSRTPQIPLKPKNKMSTYNGGCVFCGSRQPGLHNAVCIRLR